MSKKTVEDTRRELFEGEYPVPYYIMWNVDRGGYYSIHRDSTRKRGASCYDAKWQGFNAALDAVEIELPSCFETFGEYSQEAARIATECCAEAIESTNLGIKVK